jgi:SAM-dependent methyltransferase
VNRPRNSFNKSTIDFETLFDPTSTTGDEMGIRWRGSQKFRLSETLNLLKKNVHTGEINRLLDAGCAAGDFAHMAETAYPGSQITAMDVAENACKMVARDYPHYQVVNDALPNLPRFDEELDLIVAIEVINYLSPAGRNQTMDNVKDALRTGGWFLFSSVLDDGSQYFAPGEAQDLIGRHMSIVDEAYVYNTLYTSLELPLLTCCRRLRRLRSEWDSRVEELLNGDGSSARISQKRYIARALIQIHLAQVLAKGCVLFAENLLYGFLKLVWPVRLAGLLSYSFLRERGRSHVLILARKQNETQ